MNMMNTFEFFLILSTATMLAILIVLSVGAYKETNLCKSLGGIYIESQCIDAESIKLININEGEK